MKLREKKVVGIAANDGMALVSNVIANMIVKLRGIGLKKYANKKPTFAYNRNMKNNTPNFAHNVVKIKDNWCLNNLKTSCFIIVSCSG